MVLKVFYRNQRKSGYSQTAHRRGLSVGISRYSKRNSIEKPRYTRKQKISTAYMDGRRGKRNRILDKRRYARKHRRYG